jgi:hypothetical protein
MNQPKIYIAPDNILYRDRSLKYIFLAGSIEENRAEDWQTDMGEFFIEQGWGAFNPRRENWDSTWEQKFENPMFNQQVSWELDALEKADIIVLYLAPGTLSPISMLEFGLYAKSGKLYVIAPDGFWRQGNIEITCHKYNVPLFSAIDEFKGFFREHKNDL